MYLLSMIMAIPVSYCFFSLHDIWERLKYLFLNVFMLQGWSSEIDVWFAFNNVAWTMLTELLGYLLIPFIIILLRKFDLRKTISGIIVMMIIYALIIISVKGTMEERWITSVFPIVRVLDFCMGVFVGKIFKMIRLGGYILWSFAEVVVLLFSIVCICIPHVYNVMPYQGMYILIFAMLIFIYNFERGIISKAIHLICSHNQWIKYSYEFYILHRVIMTYFHYTSLRNRLGDIGYAMMLFLLTQIVVILINEVKMVYNQSIRTERI